VLAFAATLAVDGSIASRLAVAIVSLVPAMLSYSFVEHPVRFGPRFTVGLRPSYLVGAVCVTCGLLAAGLLAAAERAQLRDPYFRVLRDAVSARSADYKLESCTGVDPHDCGGAGGPMVMLIGDSHAAHWLPAVSAAVEKLGGRLAVRAYGSCPPWRVQVAVVRTGRPSEACRAFSQETDKIIERTRPSMVIVASGNYSGRLLDPSTGELFVESDEAAVWTTAVEEYLRWLAPRTREVGLILDNPYVPFDPIECLARTRSPSNCEFSPASVSAVVRDRAAERLAAHRSGLADVFDPLNRLCAGNCSTWTGGLPVFSDRTHLTAAFVRTVAPDMEVWLRALAGRAEPVSN
jgi:hypothetical protein